MFPSVDPEDVGSTGLAWLLFTYGYVLYQASNLISEGSDLLMLVPSLAGFVGGTVLPLLGAIPDGAILFFSGMGSIEDAQETLAVGVGALAGSTIMLLTVPWALSVIAGRVDLAGEFNIPTYLQKPKLSQTGLFLTQKAGVTITSEVRVGALIMMITTLPYILIQIPTMIMKSHEADLVVGQHDWSLAGFVICLVGFFSYLWNQLRTSRKGFETLKRIAILKHKISEGYCSLSGAMHHLVESGKHPVAPEGASYQKVENGTYDMSDDVKFIMKETLRDSYRRYDRNDDGTLDKREVFEILRDLNEKVDDKRVDDVFEMFDNDRNGTIDFEEFIQVIWHVMLEKECRGEALNIEQLDNDCGATDKTPDDECEESEDELPHGIASMPADEQQQAIKKTAFVMLFFGTALVVIFSDPMVDVLQEVASRAKISPFYVSFVLAPLASNASEVIASMYYAQKKTRKSITVSLTALEGAASMNNTFCLSILLGLIHFRGLVWQFTAETIAIVFVQFAVGCSVLSAKHMSVQVATVLVLLFPLSIAFVAILENLGFD
mmetsp:Transcript_52323/g.77465  ORF Transcript_52323/g.77465 Transcript_52323/m.77465 type:complete len:549 (+) Transcript_52323:83-1729(+)|eukprot:CAMPEP_0195519278 /NCGR_PEP_ID=MMETSP0794_2-20130614/14551_1 /TAXON_ID=515487 /ORGANISM="Stephanopyxis turris, Strain CCMP 815" /LENGTH=548 /DNA_ID=CAMNT_0040648401 /DNA_START=73 /DNA_END=1719 /DNA_ORIENTATION=+